MSLQVIVCGGRGWGVVDPDLEGEARKLRQVEAIREVAFLRDKLDEVMRQRGRFAFVMTGAAAGADYHAGEWAAIRGIQVQRCYANWDKFKRAAGPIRNAEMLKQARPHVVVAFPGDTGTADLVAKARAVGVEVIEFAP